MGGREEGNSTKSITKNPEKVNLEVHLIMVLCPPYQRQRMHTKFKFHIQQMYPDTKKLYIRMSHMSCLCKFSSRKYKESRTHCSGTQHYYQPVG